MADERIETVLAGLECNDKDAIALLRQMLEFNPYFRPSAYELLKSKFFDDIRCKQNQKQAPFKLLLDVDSDKNFDAAKSEFKMTNQEI